MQRFFLENRYKIVLLVSSLFFIYLIYYAPIKYAYVVPSGDDPFGHLTVLNNTIKNNFRLTGGYPFAFHLLVFLLSKLTGVSFASSMVIVSPLVLFASSWAVWFCARRFFDRNVALAAFVIYTFMAYQPLQTYYDGSFPNILGAGTLLPVFLVFYVAVFESRSTRELVKSGLLALLFFILIVFSHHLSTIYTLALVSLTLPIFVLLALKNKPLGYKIRFSLLFFLAVFLLGFLFIKTPLFTSSKVLLNQFIQFSSHAPYVSLVGGLDNPGALQRSIHDYIATLGYVPVLAGTSGLVLLVIRTLGKKAPRRAVSVMVVTWVILLFSVSRISAIGFPSRVGRELALPLSIMAGYLIVELLQSCRSWSWKSVFILSLVGLIGFFAYTDMHYKVPQFFENNRLIRFTRDDMWISQILPANSKVIVSGANQYFPLFRSDITFDSYFWWNNIEYEQIEFNNYDYLIAEDYKQESWLQNKINRKMFDTSPRLKLVRSYPQTFKTTFVYRVIKDKASLASP